MSLEVQQDIDINQGDDREFDLIITLKKQCPTDPTRFKDLEAFVGAAGNLLELRMPGTNGTLAFILTANANGSKVEVLDVSSSKAGVVHVTLSDIDTILLKKGDTQNMVLIIREGAGPDFKISRARYIRRLNVKSEALPPPP